MNGCDFKLAPRFLNLKAFTLVELLVVISVIALLLSILIPVLHKARTQAQKTVCLANLRQAGTALNLYVNDFDGCITPPRPYYPDFDRDKYPHRFTKTNAVLWQFLLLWKSGIFKENEYDKVYTDPQVRYRSFMHCPSWGINERTVKKYPAYTGPYSFGVGINVKLLQFDLQPRYGDAGYAQPKIFAIPTPGKAIYIGDSHHSYLAANSWISNKDEWKRAIDGEVDRDGKSYEHPAELWVSPWSPRKDWTLSDPYRHLKNANYTFLDGHAENLSPKKGYEIYNSLKK